ncbi:hypothetical protein C8R44DRAFT_770064 [Mycena epipterygia]|nr:hypothetical protein C8R44DRAFT_770064 [Mycena epipterygia]
MLLSLLLCPVFDFWPRTQKYVPAQPSLPIYQLPYSSLYANFTQRAESAQRGQHLLLCAPLYLQPHLVLTAPHRLRVVYLLLRPCTPMSRCTPVARAPSRIPVPRALRPTRRAAHAETPAHSRPVVRLPLGPLPAIRPPPFSPCAPTRTRPADETQPAMSPRYRRVRGGGGCRARVVAVPKPLRCAPPASRGPGRAGWRSVIRWRRIEPQSRAGVRARSTAQMRPAHSDRTSCTR